MRKTRAIAVTVAACALLSAAVLPAGAAEDPRAEYKAQVEPICKRNAMASKNILRGVRSRVRRGELRPAGRQFTRAAAALRRTLSQLRKVPRPEADARRLSKWLARVSKQATLLQQTGKALIDGRRRLAGRLITQLSSGARLTNALVVAFEFRHCRLEVSQYT